MIAELGPDVGEFAAGDEVFSFSDFMGASAGSYARYQAVDATIIARKPAALSHVEAAATPLAAGTAHDLVVSRLAVGPGDRVLVVGAAGGVGGFALQLLQHLGATVIAVARDEHDAYLRAHGAAVVLDYRDGDVYDRTLATVGEVDCAVDLVGGDTVERSIRAVRPGGRIATICGLSGDFDLAIDRNQTLHGVLVRPDGDRLSELARLFAQGVLSVEIRAVLPLDHAEAAHRLVEEGHGRGKVVLAIGLTSDDGRPRPRRRRRASGDLLARRRQA